MQVENFNSVQKQSVEMTIPNACRTLQDVHATNSTTWHELLSRILKIETNNIDKEQSKILPELRNEGKDEFCMTYALLKISILYINFQKRHGHTKCICWIILVRRNYNTEL